MTGALSREEFRHRERQSERLRIGFSLVIPAVCALILWALT